MEVKTQPSRTEFKHLTIDEKVKLYHARCRLATGNCLYGSEADMIQELMLREWINLKPSVKKLRRKNYN